MTSRPILFSASMVRAIMAGRKWKTRRVVSKSNSSCDWGKWEDLDWSQEAILDPGLGAGGYLKVRRNSDNPTSLTRVRCRFGDIGDELWVRETWADVNSEDGPAILYRADSGMRSWHEWCVERGPDEGAGPSMNYTKYPGDYVMWWSDLLSGEPGHSWRPSIHMPRWASRLTLQITNVRAERLQDISEADAKAEGVEPFSWDPEGDCWTARGPGREYRNAFEYLWGEINGWDGDKSSDANPLVWVVEFAVKGAT